MFLFLQDDTKGGTLMIFYQVVQHCQAIKKLVLMTRMFSLQQPLSSSHIVHCVCNFDTSLQSMIQRKMASRITFGNFSRQCVNYYQFHFTCSNYCKWWSLGERCWNVHWLFRTVWNHSKRQEQFTPKTARNIFSFKLAASALITKCKLP